MLVFSQAIAAPITTSLILSTLWIWVRIWLGHVDFRTFSLGFHDCIRNKQFYRIFTAPLCHQSFPHLLLNIVSLWSCREIENSIGSIHYLKCTIFVGLLDSLLFLVTAQLVSRFSEGQHPLSNSNIGGCSGILMAWIFYGSFQQMTSSPLPNKFYVVGVFPVLWSVAPLMMMIVQTAIIPRENVLSNISGITCGFLLILGLTDLFPTCYWTLCVLADVTLFLAGNILSSFDRTQAEHRRGQRNDNGERNIFAVLEWPEEHSERDLERGDDQFMQSRQQYYLNEGKEKSTGEDCSSQQECDDESEGGEVKSDELLQRGGMMPRTLTGFTAFVDHEHYGTQDRNNEITEPPV